MLRKATRRLKRSLACPIKLDPRRITHVETIESEAENVKSITFRDKLCSKANPGQYVMLWVVGTDEIPLSLSRISPDDNCGVMVERVGEATEAIHKLTTGKTIGVRGPFGNHFRLVEGNVLLIAGVSALRHYFLRLKPLKDMVLKLTWHLELKLRLNFVVLKKQRQ